MARKIETKTGNVSAILSGSGFEYVDKLLDKVAPNTKRLLENELEIILENARREWLIRGEKPLSVQQRKDKTFAAMTNTGKYKAAQAKIIIEKMELAGRFTSDKDFKKSRKSRNSKEKLEMNITVNQKFEIVATLSNSAPYAWAIKVGENSDTTVPYGKRLANELLWKPTKKIANKIAESLADEITKIK